MGTPINEAALDALFRTARTQNKWLDKPVTNEQLIALYDLMKWGPTSANSSPARILFLRTPEAKQRLLPALSPNNADKTMAAPVSMRVRARAVTMRRRDQRWFCVLSFVF